MSKRVVGMIIRTGKKKTMKDFFVPYRSSEPTVYHALVVIFLEFFAWGLLTTPMITVLNETFPSHTFLMNGLIVGIKGLLSFLSAPLIGALSDLWGRKFFLLVTVFFTCCPIPLMRLNTWWYFAMISISGVFSVTFSVVFAYVADVTSQHERSAAYGLVSATFAASLVTSPALGAYLSYIYSDNLVVFIATTIAILDVLFILFFVPESLPEKLRMSSFSIWESADPFASLKKVGKEPMILMICIAVFLSYLPEAGQYSCFFVYLRLVIGFSSENVALYIAIVGLMSVVAQTAILAALMKSVGSKNTIIIGLTCEMTQLVWYGFGSKEWMMWTAGVIVSLSSITYPAISTHISMCTDPDKQGLVQGMVTGVRGLCNGLGPAVFGLIFNLFHVDLSHVMVSQFSNIQPNRYHSNDVGLNSTDDRIPYNPLIPGPPFVFGALLVFVAILVTAFVPDFVHLPSNFNYHPTNKPSRHHSGSQYYYTNIVNSKSAEDVNAKDSASEVITPSSSSLSNTSDHKSYEMIYKRGATTSTNEMQTPLMADTEPL